LFVIGKLGVDDIHRYGLHAELRNIREADERSGGVVIVCGSRICFADEFVKSREYFGGLEGGHIEEATPNFRGREASGCKTCDDAKVVGTTFEGTPEIRIT